MSDRRLTPANGRVAAAHLRGRVEAAQYVRGEARQVDVPVADLLDAPGGRRERQLVAGADVTVYETRQGWAFVQAAADGYVGYLPDAALRAPEAVTHRVAVRSTHLYPKPDFKTHETGTLSLGSRLQVVGEFGRFLETTRGFVPKVHLAPVDRRETDPVDVAERFLGTPYLWGGNSGFGIDCSGLVQVACLACGIACPGDSDMQEAGLGRTLAPDAPLQRGDLLFWKGHVAWVVDHVMILHANAHHMAVAFEGLEEAIARIAAQGDGPVTARKRLEDWP
ncbi:C40 family peptidase [Marimonas lutisalis]|uniref:C40 family peptidase n=1 Tax=Marimonas lutisalis TaxID=2545756 RepID=UPI0010F8C55A|nr:NlpC/P60 family protein [Marimonas lutisalis]